MKKKYLGNEMLLQGSYQLLAEMLPMDDVLLEALPCFKPRDQKSVHGLQHCKK